MIPIHTYAKGVLEEHEGEVVSEFPLALTVNGRELATLVASPHALNFLVAGFLRLQGFVSSLDDFEMFSVCQDFGAANVRIKGELPERLRPVLTSGCGTGISFSMPVSLPATTVARGYTPDQVFALMELLGRESDRYRSHGGIHSAAVGDGERMLLYAEDLGRHNTLDRIAGEALFKGIELEGLMLVTSGRVSTEMAAKAAQLGISLIASRTSPTDMAVKLCNDAGITLIGYLRGGRFQVYSHHQRLVLPQPKISGVTGVILAGGKSTRMGSNKALLAFRGRPLIETVYRTMAELFAEVVVVTNTPEEYAFLPCPKIPDVFIGGGSMAGIHAGLSWSSNPRVFVVACDMPFLDGGVIRGLAGLLGDESVLVPETDGGLEPLHAFYAKGALQALEEVLTADRKKIIDLLLDMGARVVPAEQVAQLSPGFDSFRNINSPEEYSRLTP
ncbi:MAG TPA: formate dehydrogenase accessory sulfurtransferase FdhD [Geobacteraceae bacterium]|nr:formate dehydrogenase accessory sulfurtransferase FdhD [Geobacteraceae bacterium]